MAHKKIDRNTQMVVFKFGAQPLEELPESFWQIARDIKNTWNFLVGMRNKLTDNFNRLKISGKEKVKERVEYWKEFVDILKYIEIS